MEQRGHECLHTPKTAPLQNQPELQPHLLQRGRGLLTGLCETGPLGTAWDKKTAEVRQTQTALPSPPWLHSRRLHPVLERGRQPLGHAPPADALQSERPCSDRLRPWAAGWAAEGGGPGTPNRPRHEAAPLDRAHDFGQTDVIPSHFLLSRATD